MSDDGQPRLGVLNDRYELEEIVGSGGMGIVYRGRDRVLNRTVAVKTIRRELVGDEFGRRFEREAAILARMRSPHIVTVYDYGRFDDQFFLVTDFYSDGDLASYLTAQGALEPDAALLLLAQVAEGLADAHEHGVIHRDVKPANILLYRRSGELQAVLADFGIAVVEDLTITATGGVVGSPLFMAPERHLGEPATSATDIYAVGCVLVALLTGQPPYYDTGSRAAFHAASAHLNDPVPTMAAGMRKAAGINALLALCMAKKPEDRLADAADVAARLQTLAAAPDLPTGATTVMTPPKPAPSFPPPPTLPQPTRRRRRGLIAALGVLLVAGIATGGVVWATRGGDDDPVAGDTPSTSTSVTEAEGTSESADPGPVILEPPAKPQVRAESGPYRVSFTVTLPPDDGDVTYAVERFDDGWKPAGRRFTLNTRTDDTELCPQVRLVATAGAGDPVAGKPRTLCASSQKRTIELFLVDVPCNPPEEFGFNGAPCHWFDVKLSGYRPLDQVTLDTVLIDAATGPASVAPKPVYVEENGVGVLDASIDPNFGRLDGGFAIPDAWEAAKITADGVTASFDLTTLRS